MKRGVLSEILLGVLCSSFLHAQGGSQPFSYTWLILSQSTYGSKSHFAGSGDGLYTSKTYDEVWAATIKALREEYVILYSEKGSGQIIAEHVNEDPPVGSIVIGVEKRRTGIGVNIDVGRNKVMPLLEKKSIYASLFENIADILKGGVVGGVQGGAQGGGKGDVEGGVQGGVGNSRDLKEFEKGAVWAVDKIARPKPVKMVDPIYPKEASWNGIEGIVSLAIKVDEWGNVIGTCIVRSVATLDQAAIDAVRQWKYEPLVIDGKPRKAIFIVAVRFLLKEGGSAEAMERP